MGCKSSYIWEELKPYISVNFIFIHFCFKQVFFGANIKCFFSFYEKNSMIVNEIHKNFGFSK